MFVIVTSLIVR